MTVTYVFRATNRMARGLQQSDASDGAVQSLSDTNQSPADTNVATLDRSTAPAARPSTPATAAPLILSDPVDKLRRSERPGATPAAKIVTPAVPITAQLPATYVAAEGRIILVAKARGGIGATTLAVNLALEMQMAAMKRRGTIGGRIALVDLDVQLGNAGSFLDLADRGGMMALAQLAPEPDAQAVRHAPGTELVDPKAGNPAQKVRHPTDVPPLDLLLGQKATIAVLESSVEAREGPAQVPAPVHHDRRNGRHDAPQRHEEWSARPRQLHG